MPTASPKFVVCPFCNMQFGRASIAIHLGRCRDRRAHMPKAPRRASPEPPAEPSGEVLPRCCHCQRTFFADRLERHQEVCDAARPKTTDALRRRHPAAGTTTSQPNASSPTWATGWRQKHAEIVGAACSARARSPPPKSPSAVDTTSTTRLHTSPSGYNLPSDLRPRPSRACGASPPPRRLTGGISPSAHSHQVDIWTAGWGESHSFCSFHGPSCSVQHPPFDECIRPSRASDPPPDASRGTWLCAGSPAHPDSRAGLAGFSLFARPRTTTQGRRVQPRSPSGRLTAAQRHAHEYAELERALEGRGGDRECWSQYGRDSYGWRQASQPTPSRARIAADAAAIGSHTQRFEFTGRGAPKRAARMQYCAPPLEPCPRSPVSSSAYGSFHDSGRDAFREPTRAVSASSDTRGPPVPQGYAGKPASMFGLVAFEVGRGRAVGVGGGVG